jgi:hypothetical protein
MELGMGVIASLTEHIQDRVVAARRQQGPCDTAAPSVWPPQSFFGQPFDPFVDQSFGISTFPWPWSRDTAGLDKGIDLLLVDIEIFGHLFRIHECLRHDTPLKTGSYLSGARQSFQDIKLLIHTKNNFYISTYLNIRYQETAGKREKKARNPPLFFAMKGRKR